MRTTVEILVMPRCQEWQDAHYHRGFGDGENNEMRTTIGVLQLVI